MKSLKEMCIDVCWEKGFAPERWPSDVYKNERQRRFEKLLAFHNSQEKCYDYWVGWGKGFNGVLQFKHYISHNLCSYWKRPMKNHRLGLNKMTRIELILYYIPEVRDLFKGGLLLGNK